MFTRKIVTSAWANRTATFFPLTVFTAISSDPAFPDVFVNAFQARRRSNPEGRAGENGKSEISSNITSIFTKKSDSSDPIDFLIFW